MFGKYDERIQSYCYIGVPVLIMGITFEAIHYYSWRKPVDVSHYEAIDDMIKQFPELKEFVHERATNQINYNEYDEIREKYKELISGGY